MNTIFTIEGNTSGGSTLVANGGGVARKSYPSNYSRIAYIWRPKYKTGEAKSVIKQALKYDGYLEKKTNASLNSKTSNAGYNNYTRFARDYAKYTGINIQGQPWCDCFVDEIMIEALGVNRARVLLGGFSGYTPTSSNNLKNTGCKCISFSQSKYGDIIFFKNSERICHTGYVITGYDYKTGSVSDNSYTQQKFIKDVKEIFNTDDIKKVLKKTKTLSIRINSKNSLVLPIQKYLKSLGYYKGVCDKEFGKQTEEAVNKYQKEKLNYSSCDGEITAGGKMWKSMLNI